MLSIFLTNIWVYNISTDNDEVKHIIFYNVGTYVTSCNHVVNNKMTTRTKIKLLVPIHDAYANVVWLTIPSIGLSQENYLKDNNNTYTLY